MARRAHPRSVATLFVACATSLVVGTCRVAHRPGDDPAESVASAEVPELIAQARNYLETGRPWRAARALRRVLEVQTESPPDVRFLAALAEASTGDWQRARRLLEDLPDLAHENGLGLFLLARALEEAGDDAGAIQQYRAFLATSGESILPAERAAARLRLGLASIRSGDREAGRAEIRAAAGADPETTQWLALLEAEALATTGDTAAVRRAVARFDTGIPGLRAWRARILAARRAGDLAAARELANRARAWARTDATRAEFYVAAGRAAIDMGDVASGRAALRAAIDLGAGNRHAREAAALLAGGDMSPEDHLAVARVLRAQGLHEASLDGFRRWLDSGAGTAAERAEVLLEYANALFYAERYHEVDRALESIAADTQARFLMACAASYRGDSDDAVEIYLSLAARLAGTGDGAQALFLAASVRHDEHRLDEARALYRRVLASYPGTSQMGLAMMRLAGLAFQEGDYETAARTWDEYRNRYPNGSHWLEATYWAGRARAELGDEAGAASMFRVVRQRDRDSYYAVLASRQLGEPFWPLPAGPRPPVDPAAERTVAGWMRAIDLLRAAGFEEEAAAEADRVAAAAGNHRPTLYSLAEALAERGYSQRAILIGIALQATEPENPRLLRILYPFPYRNLITAEAQEQGVDPFVAAALMRQESLFEARITSPAGARGLMQIMPATGEEIARAVGLEPWDADALYRPDINVHFGMRYLAEHLALYAGSLPSVFSAYNAGPHRVANWKQFVEYADEELFTERIPFRETRDYVKILTRNIAIYSGLYGDEPDGAAPPAAVPAPRPASVAASRH